MAASASLPESDGVALGASEVLLVLIATQFGLKCAGR